MHSDERKFKLEWVAAAGICATLVGLMAPHAAAQGCAMCYQTAAASDAPGREAMRHGILILLLPAVSLFLGIFVFTYRRNTLPR
jgi:hypothetical protein